jgi:hypothetical protein
MGIQREHGFEEFADSHPIIQRIRVLIPVLRRRNMRKERPLMLLAALLLTLVLTSLALASGSYSINWYVIGGGGGPISGGGYAINSTIGQPVVGVAKGQGYELGSGFWPGAAVVEYEIYLPIVLKNYP